MPKVSVIIPTYNRELQTLAALRSVAAQTETDREIILINDGSSDPVTVLAAEASQLGARLVSTANRGVAAARNLGVALSQSPWVAFLDSDDCWAPNKLEAQFVFLAQNPSYRICQTEERWIRKGVFVNPKEIHTQPDGEAFFPSLERCVVSPSSVIIDRDLFVAAGGFDEALPACEDYELWLRLTAREPVGLVRAKLIDKFGGHPDQLSRRYPAMDRFRVYALLKLLANHELSLTQAAATVSVLITKLRILATGAAKRDRGWAELLMNSAALIERATTLSELRPCCLNILERLKRLGLFGASFPEMTDTPGQKNAGQNEKELMQVG